MTSRLKVLNAMTYDYPCIDDRDSEECKSDSCMDCANELLNEFVHEIKKELVDEICALGKCDDTDCWDCAFGDAERCKLISFANMIKEKNNDCLYGAIIKTIERMKAEVTEND